MNKFKKYIDGVFCRKTKLSAFLITAVTVIIYFVACMKMKVGLGKSVIVPIYIFLAQGGVCIADGTTENAPLTVATQIGAAVLFPFMYFITGGSASGTVIWLFFGMLCAHSALNGKCRSILCVLNMITAVVCVCVQMHNPDFVTDTEKGYTYMNLLIASLSVFGMFNTYECEKNRNEKQNGANDNSMQMDIKVAHERREKVERLTLQIMITLANTIDAKDKYTNGHSIRVAEYAREIARRAGKNEQEMEAIYFTGLLHDIGKIGIPNAIINKSSGLTDEEYEIVKTHPKIGADILKNMTEIPGIADGAHWHHELYNGQGYPDMLKGEQIPETARIIGVADAYDAMASKRSYRDTLAQQTVRAEIEKGIGKQFDPIFARIMLEMIDEDKDYTMCER